MGKYMRKGSGVGKMEVSQGSLGVRTRARALALEREQHLSKMAQRSADSSLQRAIGSSQGQSRAEPQGTYMELRSRRLEKVAKCAMREEMPFSQSDHSHEEEDSSRQRILRRSSSADELSLVAPDSASDVSRSRPYLQGASSLRGSLERGAITRPTPAASSQSRSNSISASQNQASGIVTRHQATGVLTRHQAAEMNATPSEPSGGEREMETEPGFGENPPDAGPFSKDSKPSLRRSDAGGSTRECTPESYIQDVEAPGSTSRTRRYRSLTAPPLGRTNEGPSASEIEAFFENAEQQERRRFMDRYNFDPLTETPFKGRYDWTKMR